MKPAFVYGTAWKKDATTDLVIKAVKSGFSAIDTANQPKHYSESLVGDALAALAKQGFSRESLWLQTKFTPPNGQDERVPYDPQADIATQVQQSFESSLEHLKTNHLDSYLLHGPYNYPGLGAEDWEVWAALEGLYTAGKVGAIGISNVNHLQLAALVERAKVKPMAVQNRCYASRGWDREVREICKKNGIAYQGFSLLTANVPVLRHPPVTSIAERLGVQTMQVVFGFAMQVGMIPLTGTTDEQHMKEDLAVSGIELTADEVEFLESVAG